ncbi:MAG TPA: RNA methyltransferase, partial [Verrucomicrobiae bacterium]|nr:RNA methyltransferase [Verrucomicrobiae bacterium]
MFNIQNISSFDAPQLQPYATMRRSVEHEKQGIFVAESVKVVRRLLESEFTVVSAILPGKWLEEFRSLLEARPEPITVYVAEKKLLETLVGFSMFQGVLAVGKIPPPASLNEVLAKVPKPHFLVAVDELAKAENLGALVRNCAAFGVQALIVGETSSSPFLRRAVRNSMGTIFQLPVIELNRQANLPGHRIRPARRTTPPSETLANTLHDLRNRGTHCIAAHPHANKKTLSQADFTKDCCLVFGSEGQGISPAVLEACDEAVA